MKRSIVRFAFSGVLGFVVDAGVLHLLLQVGFGVYIGRAISFLLAVISTWLVNRTFTFEVRPDVGLLREFGQYLSAMSLGGVVNFLAYSKAVTLLPTDGLSPTIAVAIGSVAGMFVNFTAAKFWIYRKTAGGEKLSGLDVRDRQDKGA